MLIPSANIATKHNCLLHVSTITQLDMSWILYKLFKYNVILSLSNKGTYLLKEPRLLLALCADVFHTVGILILSPCSSHLLSELNTQGWFHFTYDLKYLHHLDPWKKDNLERNGLKNNENRIQFSDGGCPN